MYFVIDAYETIHRLLYTWTVDIKSPSITTDQTLQYEINLIWFGAANWVNSNNFIATTLRFSEKFYHPLSPVFIFGNMFPESHGFVAMPVTSCIKDTYFNLSNCFNLPNCSSLWNETVTVIKHVKYKNMRKWMVEFLKKSESRGNKFFRVNSIRVTKFINFLWALFKPL